MSGPEREPGDDTEDEIDVDDLPPLATGSPEAPIPIRVAVDNAWRDDLDMTVLAGGISKPKSSQRNAILALSRCPDWAGVVSYDSFRDRVRISLPPWSSLEAPAESHDTWTDTDTTRLEVWLERELGVAFSRDKCEAAISAHAESRARHAVREFLDALKWDGVPRVDGLFHSYFGAEASDYTRAVSTSFMVGAVARVMRPGCQLDTLPILEGDQGIGKSSAVRALAGEWFSDSTIDFGSKDSYQQLLGVWIYELSELDALNRRDVARVKAFISAPSDRYRPSYGRRVIDVPRQLAFIGTTNADRYLSDDTGARRFLPIKCGTIDLASIKRDRPQLWAEAFHRFRKGEQWHLTAARALDAAAVQEERRIPDPWEENVEAWLKGRIDGAKPVTVTDVLNGLDIAPCDHDKFRAMRVSSSLKILGWEHHRVMVDGERRWRWFPPDHPDRLSGWFD
ncbi:MAG TPA: virulence-associated E family protein, partial [Polyangiaceae bacterium]|nr:virulence-associated E family protein [Polyangiaceae bacterium]